MQKRLNFVSCWALRATFGGEICLKAVVFSKPRRRRLQYNTPTYLRYIGGPYVAVPAIFRDIFRPSTFAFKTIAGLLCSLMECLSWFHSTF